MVVATVEKWVDLTAVMLGLYLVDYSGEKRAEKSDKMTAGSMAGQLVALMVLSWVALMAVPTAVLRVEMRVVLLVGCWACC